MIDWLYRWIYRREIRERQERMAAHAEVWRQRQVENDARWEQMRADMARARRLPPDEFLAWAETYRPPSAIRMEDT